MSDAPETPQPRPCPVCERRLPARWNFRNDDRHCGLCGLQALHLIVGYHRPIDDEVWVYWPKGQRPRLPMAWMRGVSAAVAGGEQLPLRVDLEASTATFHGVRGGHYDFRLKRFGRDGTVTTAEFEPVEGVEPSLTPTGLRGEIRLATSLGFEIRPARLLPKPEPRKAFEAMCVDPCHLSPQTGLSEDGPLWQVHLRGREVELPVVLEARVPICVRKAGKNTKPSGDRIRIVGFEEPVKIEPGKPHPFRLIIDCSDWEARVPTDFRFPIALVNLPLAKDDPNPDGWPLIGRVEWAGGLALDFLGGSTRSVVVPLGQQKTVDFRLEVVGRQEGADRDGIKIQTYRVRREPDVGDWLRVLAPDPSNLPFTVSSGDGGADLLLIVDTTRLDREAFADRDLHGWVDLIDHQKRTWTCWVIASTPSLLGLAAPVALDWGTTNSCVAYSVGDSLPRSIPLDDRQRQDPERFPSTVYFLDVGTDPARPKLLLGPDAELRARLHPECCIRSLKRKFQHKDEVFVLDEKGGSHTYRVKDLVRLVLRELIGKAEAGVGHEILELGLTFPTKWPPKVRRKLEEVARELTREFRSEGSSRKLKILPPEIDEANAVSIGLLRSPLAKGLPAESVIVAYDFGGGTVDTTVLRVTKSPLATRYIGLGGRSDFGGDEVTRAVLMLLREKLTAALQGEKIVPAGEEPEDTYSLKAIPLVLDGESLDSRDPEAVAYNRQGRANWGGLWEAAERIKIELCKLELVAVARPEGAPSSRLKTPGEVIDDGLLELATSIRCAVAVRKLESGKGYRTEVGFFTLNQIRSSLDERALGRVREKVSFTLDQACEHPLEDVDRTNGGRSYCVRERIEETIAEVVRQCQGAGVEPNLIVLAGSGCRLPLVARLIEAQMKQHFPPREGKPSPRVCASPEDLEFAKRRVANGMADYLDLTRSNDLGRGLARSIDVIHRHLGVVQIDWSDGTLGKVFVPIFREGTPIGPRRPVGGASTSDWHSFSLQGSQIKGEPGPDGKGKARRLPLFADDWRLGPQPVGKIDLDRSVVLEGQGTSLEGPLPDLQPDQSYSAELRVEAPDKIFLRVTVEGRRHGPFPLIPEAVDLETLLQG